MIKVSTDKKEFWRRKEIEIYLKYTEKASSKKVIPKMTPKV